MKIDEGVLSIALITLAAALAVLLSVGVPIVLAPEPVKLSDWLGFGGALVGAAVAFIVARVTVGPTLREVAELLKALFPMQKAVRLLGVSISGFKLDEIRGAEQIALTL